MLTTWSIIFLRVFSNKSCSRIGPRMQSREGEMRQVKILITSKSHEQLLVPMACCQMCLIKMLANISPWWVQVEVSAVNLPCAHGLWGSHLPQCLPEPLFSFAQLRWCFWFPEVPRGHRQPWPHRCNDPYRSRPWYYSKTWLPGACRNQALWVKGDFTTDF